MNALVVLIPISLVLAVLAVGVFFWAVRHDQFEDLGSPAVMPLLDEPPIGAPLRDGPLRSPGGGSPIDLPSAAAARQPTRRRPRRY